MITEFQPTTEISQNKYIPTNEYINKMDCNNEWSGDLEINLASYIFGIDISLYHYYKWIRWKGIYWFILLYRRIFKWNQ